MRLTAQGPRAPRFSGSAIALVLALSSLCIPCARAQSSSPQPAKPKVFPAPSGLPAVPQQQFIAYWTSETGWASELQLRNNSPQNLAVTPSLRLPGGAEVALPALTIQPQQVTSVDLNSAIAAANAPQLIAAWGSVVLRYSSPSAASLYAAIMLRRPGHPIALHVDAAGQWQSVQPGGREGVW